MHRLAVQMDDSQPYLQTGMKNKDWFGGKVGYH